MAAYAVALGLLLSTRIPWGDLGGALPRTAMPGFMLLFLCFFITVGGVLALFGLMVRRDNVRAELNTEQTGWLLIGIGYAAYAIALIVAGVSGLVTGATAAFLAVAALWRAMALMQIERELDPEECRKRERGRHA